MGLSGCDESLTERLDGDNVLEAISEGKESPRLEILYNIKPLYNYARTGFLQKWNGIWDTVKKLNTWVQNAMLWVFASLWFLVVLTRDLF